MPAAAQPSDEVQALLDAAVDGVVLVDHLGCIQSFSRSAEQLFGYRAQEVLGCNVGVLMTDQDRSAHDGFLARYVSTRVRHIIGTGREVSARRKDGSVFSAFLSVGVVRDTQPPRFVGFIQDRTLKRTEGLPKIETHAAQIQQATLHLVHNAVEALKETPDKDRELIVRTSRSDDGDVALSVPDTGPGVSATLLPQLFEPFSSTKPDGTGLGLAISRTIIAQHRGTLSYRPNVPRGACFVLRLPSTPGGNA